MAKGKMGLIGYIILGIIIIGIGTFIITYAPIRQNELDQLSIPESGRISRIISWKVKEPCINLGGEANLIWLGKKGEPMFAGRDNISVWVSNDELQISLIIRDKAGNIKTYINGNDWVVFPRLVKDRNFDPYAIEVIDNNGEVLLQIQLVDGCVKIGCTIMNEDGSRVQFGNNGIEIAAEGEEFQNPLKPIFAYPSKENFGKRFR